MNAEELVRLTARRYGVPEDLALRVARTESAFNQGAVSPKGARGVMQLMPGTARELGVNPDDMRQNIDGGIRYLKRQLDDFGTPELALAAYNAGPGAVRKYGGVPPYAETQNYVRKIKGGAQVQGFDGADIFGMGGSAPANGAGRSADFDGAEIFAAPASVEQGGTRDNPITLTTANRGAVPEGAYFRAADGQVYRQQRGAGYTMPQQRPPQQPAAPVRDQGLGFMKGVMKPLDNAAIWLEAGANRLGLDTNGINTALGLPSAQGAADTRKEYLRKRAAEGVLPGRIGEFGGNVVGTLAVSRLPGGPLAQGAASGALLSEDPTNAGQVARDATIGAVANRLAVAATDGLQLGARRLLSKAPQVLDLDGLQAAKRALYNKVEQSGFKFSQQEVKGLADDFAAQVREKGGPKAAQLIPASDAFAARLSALAKQKGGVTLSQLDQLRGDIYDDLISKGGSESIRGYALRKAIDDLMDASKAPFIRDARAANTAFEKVADVTRRTTSASLAAGRANSGQNVVNAARQKLSPMIDPLHSGQVRNLTPDEGALLERIVVGDSTSNALREGSNLLRNKFVSGPAAILTGAGAGPWTGLAVMGGIEGTGQLLRKGAERYTKKQIDELLQLMAVGGSKEALKRTPTMASYIAEKGISQYLRPAMAASAVPALAAARPAPKTKQKK